MRRASPFWISLLLLCLPVLASLPLSQLLGNPLAHQLLQQKKAQIEAALAERHEALDQSIRSQLSRFAFDCGPADMALLRDPRFYSRHIRLQGLKLASGGGCSSLGEDFPLATVELPPYPEQEQFGLAATQPRFNTEQEVVAYYRKGGNVAYWVLNNSWSHDQLQSPCPGCFYLEFGQQSPGKVTTFFPRGDKSIKQEPGNQSLSFFDPDPQIRQTLWAGKALEEYAKRQARHYGLLYGGALGLLLVAAYWVLRNYRRSLKGLLQAALVRREFVPFYQPIVDSRSRKVVGFEALLRWQHPSVGDVPPGLFLPLLEEARLISRLGSWIYHRGAGQRKAWETLFAEDLVLGVSLSNTQFSLPNLVTELRQVMERHALQPRQLEVEVTEEALMQNPDETRKQLRLLRNLGVRVALDDFGSGACSLAHLRDLELDTLKLDRHVIARLPGSSRDAALVHNVIDLCREYGILVIAEGVETVEQYEWLRANGCEYVQGFLVAHPMVAEDAAGFAQPFDWSALTD